MNMVFFSPQTLCRGVLLTALAVSAAAIPAAAVAGDPDTAAPEKHSGIARREQMMGPLQLNPEQRQAHQNALKQMQASMRSGMKLHDELRQLTHSDQYDEKKARALIQQRHKEAEENLVKSSFAMHEFYKSLSPDQQQQFNAMRSGIQEQHRSDMKDQGKERLQQQLEKPPTPHPAVTTENP